MSGDRKKQWTNRLGAQPVSDLVSKLLDPVIERRAGMTTDLIASWDEIVGERHAAMSRPEKLNWPRQASEDDPFEPATLVVACDGGHALFMQHDSTEVLACVNDYFGFTAVSKLKLVQKPLTSVGRRRERPTTGPLADSKRQHLAAVVKDVENNDLREALEKLGKGLFSEGSSD